MIPHKESYYKTERLNLVYSSMLEFKRWETCDFPVEIKYFNFNVFFMSFCGYNCDALRVWQLSLKSSNFTRPMVENNKNPCLQPHRPFRSDLLWQVKK